ncbi:cytochrome-c oxidase, subnunit III [gamma proteobacterium HTCC5015]|nr:cytochrome-c oxidase, subnunit III [gamma proteobacterium HTCC5015]
MSENTQNDWQEYYVAESAGVVHWGTAGLFLLLVSFALLLNGSSWAPYGMVAGTVLTIYMMFRWFADQIRESHQGLLSAQVDRTYRWGMGWFIFSEIMFFAAFFGALWYARVLVMPWLAGEGAEASTHEFLYSAYEQAWPTNGPGNWGGDFALMSWAGLPLINTLLLVTSGITMEIAHHGLKHGKRGQLNLFLVLTVLLGVIFLGCQALEYVHAYQDMNLTLESGIYGSTFFMLTGFHGMHVLVGTIMIAVIMFRCFKGHFDEKNHFAFESAAWYWHFVDVVWFGLFIFVYIL